MPISESTKLENSRNFYRDFNESGYSQNNHEALAFRQWLLSDVLSLQDIVDGIGAGERWRDALKRANERCEAVILLASSSAALKV
jgi:hypothetical protein